MKFIKIILLIVTLIGLISAVNYYFRSDFKSGWCVKDLQRDYIWQINDFELGKYRIMGWQGGAWGNSVEVKKEFLEQKNEQGIDIHARIDCPEFDPNKLIKNK